MNIKGFLYDLDDTLISRDNAFLGFTKKFYESFIDAYDFSYDEFLKIIRSADKKTKWSTEKKLLFDELRKSISLLKDSEYYVEFFWNSVVESVDPDLKANDHLKKLKEYVQPIRDMTDTLLLCKSCRSRLINQLSKNKFDHFVRN